ncbi:PREDICTED: receptor-type tyrosine-protein phosphatase-like N isoform X2 [Poecilia mexicana]|uniref:receptor-type tyrosine-protein phosphatase-like N isoform X2 n=1 Tax=Poecilia mexicana TaxID=48701 RepID=UPI00072EB4BF|nr:PREDICTED: receptor-type tyrosine-protein phosphatase-like N isoform X2 [Poecilia mexicana]
MMSPRLCAALCLLLTASCRLCSAARHGCLFEKKICPRGQLCSDDGLFGQCGAPDQKPVRYRVSSPVLLRLQEILKDLMVQGLTWNDELTQSIISRELSRVPTTDPDLDPDMDPEENPPKPSVWFPRSSRLLGPAPQTEPDPGGPAEPELMQQYLDYLVLDPYHQNQNQEQRSLNSLDQNPTFQRGDALDRDRLLLQDLLSLYLSSSPALPRHRGAPAAGSSLLPDLDFPLDYSQDYNSQDPQLKKQELDVLSGLDGRSLRRLSLLLDGLDPSAAWQDQRLDSSSVPQQSANRLGDGAAAKQKLTEALMAYKAALQEAPPPTARPPGGQKEPANQDAEGVAKLSGHTNQSVVEPAVTFRTRPNSRNLTVAHQPVAGQNFLEPETGLKVLQSGAEQTEEGKSSLPLATRVQPGSRWVFATLVSMACIGGILVAAMTIACLRRHAHRLAAKKLGLGPDGGSFTHQEYQDLCRQHMASKGAFGRLEAAALGAVGGAGSATGAGAGAVGGAGVAGGVGPDSRVSSVSSQFSDGAQPSPSSHSSTPSWCEEPAQANMDISTGHMILAYMEDHLRNKDRLLKEWAALCSYQAEPSAVSVAQSDANAKKNRCPDSVPYDHSRVKLKADSNPSRSDYVNASTIIEHDPRMPAYIATQGPLPHTISDFWQMVWENGCTVIVMMTALVEDGEKQCDRYWPDEGSSLYHIYEVNLVSEHIWCNDFLVRSFYLKNVQTQETRTLTQFHFLSWPAQGIPTSTRPLLDFRRKVNKCYRGRSCPIIVHCSDGTGRTGTYILIDMVLNRMAKGVKEIDIAATLEHVRDQRPGMVRTKDQFEFALTAVAEEVNAILKALPQ